MITPWWAGGVSTFILLKLTNIHLPWGFPTLPMSFHQLAGHLWWQLVAAGGVLPGKSAGSLHSGRGPKHKWSLHSLHTWHSAVKLGNRHIHRLRLLISQGKFQMPCHIALAPLKLRKTRWWATLGLQMLPSCRKSIPICPAPCPSQSICLTVTKLNRTWTKRVISGSRCAAVLGISLTKKRSGTLCLP